LALGGQTSLEKGRDRTPGGVAREIPADHVRGPSLRQAAASSGLLSARPTPARSRSEGWAFISGYRSGQWTGCASATHLGRGLARTRNLLPIVPACTNDGIFPESGGIEYGRGLFMGYHRPGLLWAIDCFIAAVGCRCPESAKVWGAKSFAFSGCAEGAPLKLKLENPASLGAAVLGTWAGGLIKLGGLDGGFYRMNLRRPREAPGSFRCSVAQGQAQFDQSSWPEGIGRRGPRPRPSISACNAW